MLSKWLIISLVVIYYVNNHASNGASFPRSNVISDKDEEDFNTTKQVIVKGSILLSIRFNNYFVYNSVDRGVNILFAPVNIVKTMATVLLGTAGETEKEIAEALGWITQVDIVQNLDMVHPVMGHLLKDLMANPGTELGTNLNVAAGVFIQQGFTVNRHYIELAKKIYACEVIDVDFRNSFGTDDATSIINGWISNKTMGRITTLISDPLPPETVVIFAGGLYFKGDWEYPFNSQYTSWQPFYLDSEGKHSKNNVSVQMMWNIAQVCYYQDESIGYDAIGIPYKGKQIYMYIVLPKLNLHLRNLTTLIGYNDVENIVKRSTEEEISYVIPKMKLRNMIDLRPAAQKIGIHTLFDPKKANFSNLARGPIMADRILHQVDLEIDEIGATGSAATAVSATRSRVLSFRADRPFLFFIYNKNVDLVTFWGNIYKPTPFK